MPHLAMTRLKLKSIFYLLPALIQTEKIARQARESNGFLQGKLLINSDLSLWTATLWDSSENLLAFHRSDPYQHAKQSINKWSSEAVAGYQCIELAELPDWENIRQSLLKVGSFFNLKEASLQHKNRTIASPKKHLTIVIPPKPTIGI